MNMLREKAMMITSCLSASVAADKEPMRIRRGKMNKITERLRTIVPNSVLDLTHKAVLRDTLPFVHTDNTPLSFGGESMVWRVQSCGTDGVLKVDRRSRKAKGPTLSNAERVARFKTFQQIFGDLVVDTAFCVVKQPYVGGLPALARYQAEYVDIAADVFTLTADQLRDVSTNDLIVLIDGIEHCLRNGELPDINGYNNIVVNREGRIRMLDGDTFSKRGDNEERWGISTARYHQFVSRIGLLEKAAA